MLSLHLLGISKTLQNLPLLTHSYDVPIGNFISSLLRSTHKILKLFSIILNNNYYSKIKGKRNKQQNNHKPTFLVVLYTL